MSFIKNLRESLNVSPDKEQKIVNEIEQHLEEEAHALQLQGKNSVLAKQESEQDMGDATDVARAFNKTHTTLPKLLKSIHAKHALFFFLVYAFICSQTSLLFFFTFNTFAGFLTVGYPPYDLFGQIVSLSILSIPFFHLACLSAKKIRLHTNSLAELRTAYRSIVLGIIPLNAAILTFCNVIDGNVRDAFVGRFFVEYHMDIFFRNIDALFVVIIMTSLFYMFLFLLAILTTGFSKNGEGISIKM
ncbi:MAG: hypothetical protein AAB448_03480 [Patescibacteria group bacterium]